MTLGHIPSRSEPSVTMRPDRQQLQREGRAGISQMSEVSERMESLSPSRDLNAAAGLQLRQQPRAQPD